MIVNTIPIFSRSSVDDPRPWFVLDHNAAGISCPVGNQGRQDRRTAARIPVNFGVTASHPRVEARTEIWIYGVDLRGVYFFAPESDTPEVIIAHLAFYYPLEDRLDMLEFVEIPLDQGGPVTVGEVERATAAN